MRTRTLLMATMLALGAGCFGSDPNKNSILFNPDAGVPGQTGTAGTSGGGNATGPIVGMPIATFDTGAEGFQLNAYKDTGGNTNLGDPGSGADPTFTFDATDGSPNPGCLKVIAPYTGPNQYVDIQKSMTATPQDWHGRTLHVRLKVADGTYPGGAQVYAITVPNKYIFGGTFTNVAKNSNWQEFTVNIDSPMTANSGYDPTQVIILGVQLNTGSAASAVGTVTFLIDSFSLDPPLTGATGSGGAGGSTGAAGAGGAAGGHSGAGGATGGAGSGAAGAGGAAGGHSGAAGSNADAGTNG